MVIVPNLRQLHPFCKYNAYNMPININSVTNSNIHQKYLKYWFTFWHVAMDDPVIGGDKKGWNAHFKGPTKGQIKPKADWRAVDSPKKQTNEFVLFAFLLFTANKSNSFVRFMGESTARQSAFRFWILMKGFGANKSGVSSTI